MPAAPSASAQLQLAVFIDFENLALGWKEGGPAFEVRRVLERLLEKGKVIAKVAYADWSRFREHTTSLHENGIELIEIPRRATTGKNSADIRLVVDAMDLSWSKPHIDTFVIVSGDSDFSPLVAKLKENGKHVIGLGMKASTSPLLANGCDEFIYYEDLDHRAGRERPRTRPAADADSADSDEAFRLLADTVRALKRENVEVIQASRVKDTLKRKRPAFSEAAFGYGSFSELLEDARDAGVITLREDERSGTYLVDSAAPDRQPRALVRAAVVTPLPDVPARLRTRRRAHASPGRAGRPQSRAAEADTPAATPEAAPLAAAPAGRRSRSRGRRRTRRA
jgi:uncharacterized LabA/DUF88 family protein